MSSPATLRRARGGTWWDRKRVGTRLAVIGAVFAFMFPAVCFAILAFQVGAAWLSALAAVHVLAAVLSGIGLLRAMEWARITGAIVCITFPITMPTLAYLAGARSADGTTGDLVFLAGAGLLLASVGAYLALSSTKMALHGIREGAVRGGRASLDRHQVRSPRAEKEI